MSEPKKLSEHFYEHEFRCKCPCGQVILHPGFIDHLETLRVAFARPMRVLSGCRCKAHNDLPAAEGGAGGHEKSLHVCDHPQHPGQLGTLAADIEAADGAYRGALFAMAWRLGWSVGWNAKRGFLHIDRRGLVGLPQTSFDY